MNIHLIFAYLSRLTVLMTGRTHSYYLNAFCLRVLARYFLVHGTNCVDHKMCLVVAIWGVETLQVWSWLKLLMAWRISSMVHHNLKDNCAPLVGLRCCSYYSTSRIARHFGNRQVAPSDNGSFHTLTFIDRTLGRIRESWSRWRVTNGIYPTQFLHPTLRYKKWLEDDMKWVPIDKKAYMKSNKRKRTE